MIFIRGKFCNNIIVYRILATSSQCVNLSLTVQSTQSQDLNYCTFSLLLPTICFGHLFDRYQEEKKNESTKTKNAT